MQQDRTAWVMLKKTNMFCVKEHVAVSTDLKIFFLNEMSGSFYKNYTIILC